jgi:predicted secreted Zn-dependent protease
MKPVVIACLAAVASSWVCAASAGVKVSVKNTTYQISGKTGAALVDAMDRKGPKHGLLARAIAQTRYSVGWDIQWANSKSTCKVKSALGRLDITYVYPAISGPATPGLKRSFHRFLKGVRQHEEQHGKIARDMVTAAERSIRGVAIKGDSNCARARAEAKRRVAEIYARYEAKQVAFDEREHRPGGHVESLVSSLIRK